MTEEYYEYVIPLTKFNYVRMFALEHINYIVFNKSVIPMLDKSIEMTLVFCNIKQNSFYQYISYEDFIDVIKNTHITENMVDTMSGLLNNTYSVYFKSPVKNLDAKIIMIS